MLGEEATMRTTTYRGDSRARRAYPTVVLSDPFQMCASAASMSRRSGRSLRSSWHMADTLVDVRDWFSLYIIDQYDSQSASCTTNCRIFGPHAPLLHFTLRTQS